MISTDNRPHAAAWPRRLPRDLIIPETTLWFNLEVSARRYPDKAAYVFFGRALSFRELHRQAEALAGWLQARGVRAGDRVLLYMQNCPQFVVAFYAILRADAVVVPVNPMNRVDEFGHYITDPQARVAVTTADLAATVAEASQRLPEGQRLQHVLVTRFTDAMPATLAPADSGGSARSHCSTASEGASAGSRVSGMASAKRVTRTCCRRCASGRRWLASCTVAARSALVMATRACGSVM